MKNSQIKEEIYHASSDTLVDVISRIDNSINSALIFGHNPGLTYLYNTFTKDEIDNLPTCGIFRLKINATNWTDIDTTNTSADRLMYPKLLNLHD